jgi:hypothetical protein
VKDRDLKNDEKIFLHGAFSDLYRALVQMNAVCNQTFIDNLRDCRFAKDDQIDVTQWVTMRLDIIDAMGAMPKLIGGVLDTGIEDDPPQNEPILSVGDYNHP